MRPGAEVVQQLLLCLARYVVCLVESEEAIGTYIQFDRECLRADHSCHDVVRGGGSGYRLHDATDLLDGLRVDRAVGQLEDGGTVDPYAGSDDQTSDDDRRQWLEECPLARDQTCPEHAYDDGRGGEDVGDVVHRLCMEGVRAGLSRLLLCIEVGEELQHHRRDGDPECDNLRRLGQHALTEVVVEGPAGAKDDQHAGHQHGQGDQERADDLVLPMAVDVLVVLLGLSGDVEEDVGDDIGTDVEERIDRIGDQGGGVTGDTGEELDRRKEKIDHGGEGIGALLRSVVRLDLLFCQCSFVCRWGGYFSLFTHTIWFS